MNDGLYTKSLLAEWFQLHGHFSIPIALVDIRRKTDNRPAEFVQSLQADVVLLDVNLPYAVNWYYAEMLTLALPTQAIVLTTRNRAALESIVGASGAFELTGTNENLTALLAIVYAAAGRGRDGTAKPVA